MNEFDLIEAIKAALGEAATADWLVVGPGDDCSVSRIPAGTELVSSIDTLVSGRHFPADAAPYDIGYRSLMVSISDLAAMGAEPYLLLVAAVLEAPSEGWVAEMARGMRDAALATGARVGGGNLAQGPLSISVSAHGLLPCGEAVLRSGAAVGDRVYLTGRLGGAAAALAQGFDNDALNAAYFRPTARVDLSLKLRAEASSAIDVSDGLLQDAGHVAKASGVCLSLRSADIPVADGASLEQALSGGDDYELLFTASDAPAFAAISIGEVVAGPGVLLDGEVTLAKGYQHFA